MTTKKTVKKGKKKLTLKQSLFVHEYLACDFNATQAAIKAGFSEKTAGSQGQRLLKNVEIAESIAKAMEDRVEKIKIDANWVLEQAVKVHQRCMQAEPVYDRKGDRVYVETPDGGLAPAFTFEHAGANKSLEIIGKHVDVQAFREQVGIGNPDGSPHDNEWKITVIDGGPKPADP